MKVNPMKPVVIKLPSDLIKSVDTVADKLEWSRSHLIRNMVADGLNKYGVKDQASKLRKLAKKGKK